MTPVLQARICVENMTNLVKRSVRKESIREVDYRRNKAAIISVLIIISKGNFQKEKNTNPT